jgi:4-hydroxybenzoyl-CoA thioesterase
MRENVVERTIMWGDLDPLGIVFYPRYYEWMDACGHLFFDALQLNLGDLWKQRDLEFGLVETSCRYVKPGRYHQKILIHTGIADLTRKTILLEHRFHASSDGSLMVEGREKRICLRCDHAERFRAEDIPEDILALLTKATEGRSTDPSSIPA